MDVRNRDAEMKRSVPPCADWVKAFNHSGGVRRREVFFCRNIGLLGTKWCTHALQTLSNDGCDRPRENAPGDDTTKQRLAHGVLSPTESTPNHSFALFNLNKVTVQRECSSEREFTGFLSPRLNACLQKIHSRKKDRSEW